MVRLGPFSGVLREMVLEVKFTRWRRLGHDLGVLLGQSVLAAAENEGLTDGQLVPVPMSLRRRLARGIDHTMVIARGIAAVTGWEIVRGLERRHRPAQASLPATQRRTNIANAIRARSAAALEPRLTVVVDDVTTTRATMNAACHMVRKVLADSLEGGIPQVWGAVLGVTPAPARQVMPMVKKKGKGEGGQP